MPIDCVHGMYVFQVSFHSEFDSVWVDQTVDQSLTPYDRSAAVT